MNKMKLAEAIFNSASTVADRLDASREKEAKSYPRYNPNSTQWTWNIKGTRLGGCEISILRSNNRHGFISWGWFNDNDKILVYSTPYNRQVLPKLIFENLKSLAQQGARVFNNKRAA